MKNVKSIALILSLTLSSTAFASTGGKKPPPAPEPDTEQVVTDNQTVMEWILSLLKL